MELNLVVIQDYRNSLEIHEHSNSVEVTKIDIETSRYFLSQFQMSEEHREVT